MTSKRTVFVLMLFIVALATFSCVSAEDSNATQNLATFDDVEMTQTIENDNIDESVQASPANAKITPVTLSGGYKTGKATIRLTDISTETSLADKTVKLTVLGDVGAGFSNKTDGEGIATFYFKDLYYFSKENDVLTSHVLSCGNWNVKLEADDEGIAADEITETLTVNKINAAIKLNSLSADYGSQKSLNIYLTDSQTGNPIQGEVFKMYMPGTANLYYFFSTDNNGKSSVDVSKLMPATYQVVVNLNSTQNINASQASAKVVINKIKATIKPTKLTATYGSAKYFKIKVTDTNGAVEGLKLKLKVYTGSNYKTVYVTTDKSGIAKYKVSSLSKGTHKVTVINTNTSIYSAKSVSSSIVINAKKLYITGEDYKFKQGGGLILAAYDKQNDKYIKGVKLQIKIYKNSKKYKTYNLVTGMDKKTGISDVVFETNQFSAGKHKVVVKIISSNYKGSDSGTITIPKSAAKYGKFTYVLSNGKEKFL